MNKREYLAQLERELKRNHVPDAGEILNEYAQHFAFKLADGYSEEEISARLGEPAALAAQFDGPSAPPKAGNKPLAAFGLCFVDLLAVCLFLTLLAWSLAMGAAALGCGALGLWLLFGGNPEGLVPMPGGCGAAFGLSAVALALLWGVGCVYFYRFLGQLCRAYGRFHHNALAAAGGEPVLPSLPLHPRFSPKASRRMRKLALLALAIFALCGALGMALSMFYAGAIEFWHAWGWFGYSA